MTERCDCGWELPQMGIMFRLPTQSGLGNELMKLNIMAVILTVCPVCGDEFESEYPVAKTVSIENRTRDEALSVLHAMNQTPGKA